MQHTAIPDYVTALSTVDADAIIAAAADATIAALVAEETATDAVATETKAKAKAPACDPPASALVNRAELAAAVAATVRAVEKRTCIPVLGNLLLRATDGGLAITGTNLDIAITAIAGGEADSQFVATIPAHNLADLLKKAKPSEMVAIDIKGETATLDFEGLKVTLNTLPSADFPQLAPSAPKDGGSPWSTTFDVPSGDLARLLGKTAFAISTEETRYYLNGVYLHVGLHNGKATALRGVATDGHRLAQCDVPLPDGASDMAGVIVPRQTVGELIRLTKGKGVPPSVRVRLTTGRVESARIEFTVGGVTVLSKLIDGCFPDYGRVIPAGNDKRLVIDREALDTAVGEVMCIATERGKAVRCGLEAEKITLSVTNPDTGMARTEIGGEFDGLAPMDIGFNADYLRAILAHIEGARAEFKLGDPGSPALIHGLDDADAGVTFVLMPMRI